MVSQIRKHWVHALGRIKGHQTNDAESRKEVLARLRNWASEYERLHQQVEHREEHESVTVWRVTHTI